MVTWLVPALVVATLTLSWSGYRATREWEQNAAQLVQRRGSEVLALLITALNKDMKGAHVSLLTPLNAEALAPDPPQDLREACARIFARFPYPESFFLWKKQGGSDGVSYMFNRADRPPAWNDVIPLDDPYPVVLERNPLALGPLLAESRKHADGQRSYALLQPVIAGVPYQVGVHLIYDGQGRLLALAGFTVNMTWVREHYFGDLVRQVARIGGAGDEMTLVIRDDGQRVVTSNHGILSTPLGERRFPLLFIDPDLVPTMVPRPAVPYWTAAVAVRTESTLNAVALGARRTLVFIAVATLATLVGLLVTVRAVRARARLTSMQSEFVSAVTHDLKTPLASIRLVSDTLASGRFNSRETIGEYAGLLSQETARLTRLIDNLLTHSRLTEGAGHYHVEAIDVVDLVEDALEHFEGRLLALGFRVTVLLPPGLPRVRVDRGALLQVLDNVIDNAIRYSKQSHALSIEATAGVGTVRVDIGDQGVGIPGDEIDRVFERFFRGRGSVEGGSGLGLTIARRIVHDHGGTIAIRPAQPVGTVVSITLPAGGAS